MLFHTFISQLLQDGEAKHLVHLIPKEFEIMWGNNKDHHIAKKTKYLYLDIEIVESKQNTIKPWMGWGFAYIEEMEQN